MNINLNSQLENLVQKQIISGKYTNAENVIEEALNLLEKRNQYDDWVKEIGQKIDLADEQLNRGEGIDGTTGISQLREYLIQGKHQK